MKNLKSGSRIHLSFLIIVILYILNKCILLMRKGVYPYKYMNDLKRFIETVSPRKEDFYSNLNMDSDYNYAKRVCEGFKIKNFGEY